MKTYHKDFAYSYTLGVFPTLELLTRQPELAIRVLLSPLGDRNQGVQHIKSLCTKYHLPVENLNLSSEPSLPGDCYAVGVFKKFDQTLEPVADHLVLVEPRDMGNLGTIIRTMIGFNYHHLAIIKPAADIFDPKTVRASMGSLFQINFQYFGNFKEYIDIFKHHLYTFSTDASHRLNQVAFKHPTALVFGNESSGLPRAITDLGTNVRIPFSSAIDSLNLAVSVGIALYHNQSQTLK